MDWTWGHGLLQPSDWSTCTFCIWPTLCAFSRESERRGTSRQKETGPQRVTYDVSPLNSWLLIMGNFRTFRPLWTLHSGQAWPHWFKDANPLLHPVIIPGLQSFPPQGTSFFLYCPRSVVPGTQEVLRECELRASTDVGREPFPL